MEALDIEQLSIEKTIKKLLKYCHSDKEVYMRQKH